MSSIIESLEKPIKYRPSRLLMREMNRLGREFIPDEDRGGFIAYVIARSTFGSLHYY